MRESRSIQGKISFAMFFNVPHTIKYFLIYQIDHY